MSMYNFTCAHMLLQKWGEVWLEKESKLRTFKGNAATHFIDINSLANHVF